MSNSTDQETSPLTDGGEVMHAFPDPLSLPSCSSDHEILGLEMLGLQSWLTCNVQLHCLRRVHSVICC